MREGAERRATAGRQKRRGSGEKNETRAQQKQQGALPRRRKLARHGRGGRAPGPERRGGVGEGGRLRGAQERGDFARDRAASGFCAQLAPRDHEVEDHLAGASVSFERLLLEGLGRSEERRVGTEWRS